MSVLLLAIGTTRARAVCGTAEFLLARDVEVGLVTVDPADWAREGLPDGVRVYALGEGEQRHPLARLGRLVRRLSGAAGRIYAKFYRLLRPYVMWRVARAGAVKRVDWPAVEQLVICDSHAIPIGWHLAKRHPKLTVGFELDRAPYAEREPARAAPVATVPAAAATAAPPSPSRPAGIDVDA
jgi:hypothetical protein